MYLKRLSFILFVTYACVQKQPEKLPALSILDFNGQPDYSINALAFTYCGVFYRIIPGKSCSYGNKINVSLSTEVKLFRDRSWIKKNKIKDRNELIKLLSHEQGHYDLFGVFEIDFKNAVENKCFYRIRYKMQIDSIYKEMFMHYDTLQRKYDVESEGMRNEVKQAEWKLRIQKMYNDVQHRSYK